MKETVYYCPNCKSEVLMDAGNGLQCSNGHFFPFVEETKVPVFDSEDGNTNEYTCAEAAKIHDNALNWLSCNFGYYKSIIIEDLQRRKENMFFLLTFIFMHIPTLRLEYA